MIDKRKVISVLSPAYRENVDAELQEFFALAESLKLGPIARDMLQGLTNQLGEERILSVPSNLIAACAIQGIKNAEYDILERYAVQRLIDKRLAPAVRYGTRLGMEALLTSVRSIT